METVYSCYTLQLLPHSVTLAQDSTFLLHPTVAATLRYTCPRKYIPATPYSCCHTPLHLPKTVYSCYTLQLLPHSVTLAQDSIFLLHPTVAVRLRYTCPRQYIPAAPYSCCQTPLHLPKTATSTVCSTCS